ncbi:hypothetical protein [Geodermatophilus sp. URMC 63]
MNIAMLAEELRPRRIRVEADLASLIDMPAHRVDGGRPGRPRGIPDGDRTGTFLVDPDAAPLSGARVPVLGGA